MSRAPYRTVLVGFGAIAQGLSSDRRMAAHFRYATHAQVLHAHPRFEWCATVDPDPAARRLARRQGAGEVFSTIAAAQARFAPEVAVIATPPTVRLEVLRAFPGLRGVIVEKPLGTDLAAARRFSEACVKSGITVQVCFWRRADRTLRRLARDGARTLGQVQAGFALYGNGLRNNGVHLVDLIRMQAGEIVAVQAFGSATKVIRAPIRGDVAISGALQLASGAMVSLAPLDFTHYREVALDLWGTRGRRSFDQETLRIVDFPRVANRGLEKAYEIASDRPRRRALGATSAFYDLYDNLADALGSGGGTWSDTVNALRTEAVVSALLQSAARGGTRIALDGK